MNPSLIRHRTSRRGAGNIPNPSKMCACHQTEPTLQRNLWGTFLNSPPPLPTDSRSTRWYSMNELYYRFKYQITYYELRQHQPPEKQPTPMIKLNCIKKMRRNFYGNQTHTSSPTATSRQSANGNFSLVFSFFGYRLCAIMLIMISKPAATHRKHNKQLNRLPVLLLLPFTSSFSSSSYFLLVLLLLLLPLLFSAVFSFHFITKGI